jgi:hypothetical protein
LLTGEVLDQAKQPAVFSAGAGKNSFVRKPKAEHYVSWSTTHGVVIGMYKPIRLYVPLSWNTSQSIADPIISQENLQVFVHHGYVHPHRKCSRLPLGITSTNTLVNQEVHRGCCSYSDDYNVLKTNTVARWQHSSKTEMTNHCSTNRPPMTSTSHSKSQKYRTRTMWSCNSTAQT